MTISTAEDFLRENWDDDEIAIFRLFNFRCLVCPRTAVVLHEIIPKSKAPKTWNRPENKVPLCAECHEEIHRHGAMRYVEFLTTRRAIRANNN